jgi:hypothetical protein
VTADHFVVMSFTDTIIKKPNDMAEADFKSKLNRPLTVKIGNKIMEDNQGVQGAPVISLPQAPNNTGYITNEMLENRGDEAAPEVASMPSLSNNYNLTDGADLHQAKVDSQDGLGYPFAENTQARGTLPVQPDVEHVSVPAPLQSTAEHAVPGDVMMEPSFMQPAKASVPLLQVINKPSPVKHNYSTRRNRVVDYS